MTFSMTLEMKDTLAIGRKLAGSVGSRPSCLRIGIKMDLFWLGGRTPSMMERLQSVVRSGNSMSTYSRSRNVGRGSSSQDFGAAVRMIRRSSVGLIAVTVDRLEVVGGNIGGGESAV